MSLGCMVIVKLT